LISETCEAFQEDIVEVGDADAERAVFLSATAIAVCSHNVFDPFGDCTTEEQERMLQIHHSIISDKCHLLQKEVETNRDRLAIERERVRMRAVFEKERDKAEKERLRVRAFYEEERLRVRADYEKERLRAQVVAEEDINRSKQSLIDTEIKNLELEIELARIKKEPLSDIVAKYRELHKRHFRAYTIEQQERMVRIYRNVISNQCEIDTDEQRLATEEERLRAEVAAEQDKNRSKQSFVESEIRRLEQETKRIERKIELARINKEVPPAIVAKSSGSHKRKREADATNNDEEQLKDRTSAPYRGLRSLSFDVWQSRPDNYSKSLISVINEFHVWAMNTNHLQGVKCDMRCIRVGKTNLDIVYCNSAVNTKPIVQSFWYTSPVTDTHLGQ
jgi:hypothetical protein